jgi:hypothetical protein
MGRAPPGAIPASPTQAVATEARPSLATIKTMSFPEGLENKSNKQETLHQQFTRLRRQVHVSMKVEEQIRLKENPKPSEEELHMGAFKEWLEPQVRDAMSMMFKKGYATQSSGFDGIASLNLA